MSLSKIRRNELTKRILIEISQASFETKKIHAIAKEFDVSVQSVYNLVNKLCEESVVKKTRQGKTLSLSLVPVVNTFSYNISTSNEDIAFSDVKDLVKFLPENAFKIYEYVFSEMFNNAVEHSEGSKIVVCLHTTSVDVTTFILDNGIGIFEKIKEKFHLEDRSQSVFELMKGKVTTDPNNHSGEGIFFSSKCSNLFFIVANGLTFVTTNMEIPEDEKAQIESYKQTQGTAIVFNISIANKFNLVDIFNQYADPDKGFYKTMVSVQHLEYNETNPNCISRSQARRLMAGMEKFEEVTLDFGNIPEIGQAFADEVFRVWQNKNPAIKLNVLNANKSVSNMIKRIENNKI